VPRAAPRALPRRAGRRGTLPPAALAALGRPPTAHSTAPEHLCSRDGCQRTCIPPLTSALRPPPRGAQVALGWVPCRAMFAFVFRRISAPPSGDSSGGLEAFLYMWRPSPSLSSPDLPRPSLASLLFLLVVSDAPMWCNATQMHLSPSCARMQQHQHAHARVRRFSEMLEALFLQLQTVLLQTTRLQLRALAAEGAAAAESAVDEAWAALPGADAWPLSPHARRLRALMWISLAVSALDVLLLVAPPPPPPAPPSVQYKPDAHLPPPRADWTHVSHQPPKR